MTNRELKDRIMSGISESLMTVLGNGNSLNELKSETLRRASHKAYTYGDNERGRRFNDYAKEVERREIADRYSAVKMKFDNTYVEDIAVLTLDDGNEFHVVRYYINNDGRIMAHFHLAYLDMEGRYCYSFMIDDLNCLVENDDYDDAWRDIALYFGMTPRQSDCVYDETEEKLFSFDRKASEEIADFINTYVPATEKGDRVSYRNFYSRNVMTDVKMTARKVRTQRKVKYVDVISTFCADKGCNIHCHVIEVNDNWKFSRHITMTYDEKAYMAAIDDTNDTAVLINEDNSAMVMQAVTEREGKTWNDSNVSTDPEMMLQMIACALKPREIKDLQLEEVPMGHSGSYGNFLRLFRNSSDWFMTYADKEMVSKQTCRYIDIKDKDSVLSKVNDSMSFLPDRYIKAKRQFEEEDMKRAGNVRDAWDALQKALQDHGVSDADIRKVGDAYRVDLFGKRGVYDETDDREYVRKSPSMCRKIMTRIKDLPSGVMIKVISFRTVDDVPDLKYSRDMQTECYGQRTTQITMLLSTGKKLCIFA